MHALARSAGSVDRVNQLEGLQAVLAGDQGPTARPDGVGEIEKLTLERLETLNLAVVGYRTTDYPGFYIADSGHDIDHAVDSPAEIAEIARSRDGLGIRSTLLVANPVAPDSQLDPALHDEVLSRALAAAAAQGVTGHDTTPFLLDFVQRETGGRSLDVNVEVYRGNVELGALIALELAERA